MFFQYNNIGSILKKKIHAISLTMIYKTLIAEWHHLTVELATSITACQRHMVKLCLLVKWKMIVQWALSICHGLHLFWCSFVFMSNMMKATLQSVLPVLLKASNFMSNFWLCFLWAISSFELMHLFKYWSLKISTVLSDVYLLAADAVGCATVVKTEKKSISHVQLLLSCFSPAGHTELLLK